jgi:hypothetical protein
LLTFFFRLIIIYWFWSFIYYGYFLQFNVMFDCFFIFLIFIWEILYRLWTLRFFMVSFWYFELIFFWFWWCLRL